MQERGIKVIQWQEDRCNKYQVWAACDVGWRHKAVRYGCRSVTDGVCKRCTWMCDLWMNWGFFFLLEWRQKWQRLSVSDGEVEGAGEGWDENRIILTLPFLTFIMLKGHSEHPASSSPVVLWQAQTLHNLVAPRYHHSSHYLAKPIPFDLCSWCTLFTIGRAPTCTSALVKETQERKEESASEWMTGRRRETERESQRPETRRQ